MGISNLEGLKGNQLPFPSNQPLFLEVTALVSSSVMVTISIALGFELIWSKYQLHPLLPFITIVIMNKQLSKSTFSYKTEKFQLPCVILEI